MTLTSNSKTFSSMTMADDNIPFYKKLEKCNATAIDILKCNNEHQSLHHNNPLVFAKTVVILLRIHKRAFKLLKQL